MRRITSWDELTPIIEAEQPIGYVRGLLPSDMAPADVVYWLLPITLERARATHNKLALRLRADYSEGAGHCAAMQKCVCVSPSDWTAAPSDPPDDLVPLWDSWEQARELGDPMVPGSHGNVILTAVQEASGFVLDGADEDPPRTFDEMRARRHRGRWVAGIFPTDPDAAVWVAPFDEATRDAAQARCEVAINKDGSQVVIVEIAALKPLLAAVVRTGPGGEPLMCKDDPGRLPYGAARALYYVAHELTYSSTFERTSPHVVRLFRGASADGAAAGGGGPADLVDGGEARPDAGGDAPAAGDDDPVDGRLAADADEDQPRD